MSYVARKGIVNHYRRLAEKDEKSKEIYDKMCTPDGKFTFLGLEYEVSQMNIF